ncbi:hypothetical protein EBS02_00380 [bacterium]|nr:hypothetical protein [bacterium]
MPFGFDSVSCGNQLHLGENEEKILVGIRGAADLQGPILIGSNGNYPQVGASLMVAPLSNSDSPTPSTSGNLCGVNNSPYSLAVIGDAVIFDNLEVNKTIHAGADIVAQGDVKSQCGGHRLSLKKNFDISHPIKDGWRLRHTCLEGPSNDVYYRGRLVNDHKIILPEYWKELVDKESITVSVTPIGGPQDIYVASIHNNVIYLESYESEEIHCFYHVYGERKDGEKLIVEYEGETPADYPGNSEEYSIVGWDYDTQR